MDLQPPSLCLVLLLLTSVSAAPHVSYARAALDPIGRLGLTMSAETITDVAKTRDEPQALVERGLQNEDPSTFQLPNYWTPSLPSRGRAPTYILIPVGDPHQSTRAVQNQKHKVVDLPASPMTNKDLYNHYKHRATTDSRPTLFPIHINIPESVDAVSTWLNSLPIVYRWQQAQVNQPRIYVPMLKSRNGMFVTGRPQIFFDDTDQVSNLPMNNPITTNMGLFPRFNELRPYNTFSNEAFFLK